MRLRFSLSAAVLISAVTLLAISNEHLVAQQPTASAAKPKVGYVRFWNMTIPTANVVLELVAGSTPDAHALNTASPANYYAGYAPLIAASYALRVYRAGDRQQAIKSFELTVKDHSYFTLFATQESGGPITVELIDDTPAPTKVLKNRLTIRQFCQDMTVVVVASGNYKSDPTPYGKTTFLEGMPNGNVPLSVRATKTRDNAVKTWDTTADFRVAHRATLFIVNDLYGRMRARVAMDGPSPEEEAAAAEAARNNVQ